MKHKLLKLSTIALASATLFTTSIGTTFAQEDVIAQIGETKITKDQFYTAMKKLSGEVTLRTMILEEVLKQNVKDSDALKKAAEEEVKKQIEEAGGAEAFQQLLDYQQLGSVDEYTYQIFVRNMFQNVVEQHIDTSDKAIQKYYDETYQAPMEAQHILVETEEQANEVLKRLNDGEEFDAVAQEVSKDSTAANGGLLGEFLPGQMVPEFEEAVKTGKNGELVAKPVKTQHGFHVIKVLNNGEKQPLDKIKDKVVEQYKVSKFADSTFAYSVIGRLIEEKKLKINDADLENAVSDLIELGKEPAAPKEEKEEKEEKPAEEAAESKTEESEAAAE